MLVEVTAIALDQYHAANRSSTTTGLVHAIVAEIADHLTDPDLRSNQSRTGLRRNPDYLGREFKSLIGFSIGEYILRQRIRQAEQLLRNGSDHMPDVAGLRLRHGATLPAAVSPADRRVPQRISHASAGDLHHHDMMRVSA